MDQRVDHAQATWDLAGALLMEGRYTEAWPLLDARKALRPDNVVAPTDQVPEWRGEPVSGKTVLVWTEQGFGDQIMFARFAQCLRERGARVILAAWKPVAPLFAKLADEVLAVTPGGHLKVPPFDYWTHYFSLPEHLGITLQNLPREPYLGAPMDRRRDARWECYRGRIGLMWRSQSRSAESKNMPPELASSLLGDGLVSLQPEDTGARDFAETAAIIDQMALVVTIDTAMAHLAGAMGKPVWVLLPARGVDWRWLREGPSTPWYPTARLFRQPSPGDWASVVAEVKAALG